MGGFDAELAAFEKGMDALEEENPELERVMAAVDSLLAEYRYEVADARTTPGGVPAAGG